MAVIGSFGFGGITGQFDMNSESLLGALESSSFAPSPFAGAGISAPPQFQIGANPVTQILPLLLGALQGLGQGWSQYGGGSYPGGGGYPGGGFPGGGFPGGGAPQPPMQHGGGGCHK